MPNRSHTTSLETYTGEFLSYLTPAVGNVKLEDIARSLSQTVRFRGQTNRWYSVAEHAVRVSYLVQERVVTGQRWDANMATIRPIVLAALHHDSHEAYVGDIPSPLKWALAHEVPGFMETFDVFRAKLDSVIGQALGFPSDLMKDSAVKSADDLMMYREAATLKYSHGMGEHWGNDTKYTPLVGIGWSPDKAERAFIKRHLQLIGEQHA